jgi:MioC protein
VDSHRIDGSNLFPTVPLKRSKTHDCTDLQDGTEYVFEPIDPLATKAYMTGQRRGIRKGDWIILNQSDAPTRYRVQEIDYYASPSDMWIALLVREEVV